jgi:hypothetical protein
MRVERTQGSSRRACQHRPNGRPLVVREFVAHDSAPSIRGLDHGSAVRLNTSRQRAVRSLCIRKIEIWIASPFDPPRAPPFGGSHEGRDCTTSMREETMAPARLSIEGAVTHGNGNSSGSTGRAGNGIRGLLLRPVCRDRGQKGRHVGLPGKTRAPVPRALKFAAHDDSEDTQWHPTISFPG